MGHVIILSRLIRFGWVQAQCCVFAVAIFLGLAVTTAIWHQGDLPIARYDALLIYVLAVQVTLLALGQETWRELLVICCFHLLGLALEIYKVRIGSWSYPDPGLLKIAEVPLFSGFMYAAVGSYMCQAFRRFGLTFRNLRWGPLLLVAVAIYTNFFTNAFLPDLRLLLALAIVVVTWDTKVFFTVGPDQLRMPLSISFVLIGGFLWLAENIATFLGAWQYPYQERAWQLVHVNKFGSWALLVCLSFALVAIAKSRQQTVPELGQQPQRQRVTQHDSARYSGRPS